VIRKDVTDDMIIKLYYTKGLNRRQTAEKLLCSQDLIAYRIKKMGLLPKSMSDCVEAGKKRTVNISKKLLEIIDGELLGDGYIWRNKNQGSFRESVGYNKKPWITYLSNIMNNNDIPIVGDKIYLKKPSGKSKNQTWSFGTVNVMELGDIHKLWYVENKEYDKNLPNSFSNRKFIKTVPKNLTLTPTSLLHWYIGDGSVGKGGGCVLYTQGFTYNEVEFLRLRLKEDLNIVTSNYNGNTIGVPRAEREKMLKIIGPCLVDCYKYKWEIPSTKYRKYRKINNNINYLGA